MAISKKELTESSVNEEIVLTREDVESTRRNEYMVQADPLYFEYARLGTEESRLVWLAKIDEIKNRNPYPLEPNA